MVVITKKQILGITSLMFIGVFVVLLGSANLINSEEKIVETASLPVSGKVIVVDAGHGKPDERCRK